MNPKEVEILNQIKLEFYQKSLSIASIAFTDVYKPYLDSVHWEAKRKVIFKRDGYICRYCGISKAVQVHHLSYANLGNESDFELMSVCIPCHKLIHAGREETELDLVVQPNYRDECELMQKEAVEERETQSMNIPPLNVMFELPVYQEVHIENTTLNTLEFELKRYLPRAAFFYIQSKGKPVLVARNTSAENVEIFIGEEQTKIFIYGLSPGQFQHIKSHVEMWLKTIPTINNFCWHSDGLVIEVKNRDGFTFVYHHLYVVFELSGILKRVLSVYGFR